MLDFRRLIFLKYFHLYRQTRGNQTAYNIFLCRCTLPKAYHTNIIIFEGLSVKMFATFNTKNISYIICSQSRYINVLIN